MGHFETNKDIWTHRDNAVEITGIALRHYEVHRRIVLRKLKLAQKAVESCRRQEDFEAVSGLWAKIKTISCNFHPSQKCQDQLWEEIIALFSSKAIYEDDLFQIEYLLEKMPKDTQERFFRLSNKDASLCKLQKNLNSEGYQQAKKKIAQVQKHKNPLTGLSAEDYEQGLLRHLKVILFRE